MAGYGAARGSTSHGETSPISLAWVILAALVAGVGVFLVALWLITFNWLFFPGAIIVAISMVMFLSPRMGLDHS